MKRDLGSNHVKRLTGNEKERKHEIESRKKTIWGSDIPQPNNIPSITGSIKKRI